MDPTCGKNNTSKYYLLVTVVSLQQFRSTPRDVFPNVTCDYRAPDNCNPNNPPVPCCQRPEVLGFTPITMDTTTTMDTTSIKLLILPVLLVLTVWSQL